MFESSQLDSPWKVSPRIVPWVGLPGAFSVGLLAGVLWAGALPFDAFRIVCLVVLVGFTILSVVLFNRRSKSQRPSGNLETRGPA
jgi:ABC-type spermidine/putrescine transport system permease subunit II